MTPQDIDNYQIEDTEEETNVDPSGKKHKGSTKNVILLLLEIMVNPTQGWKTFRRARLRPEEVANGCFYPLAGLAALSSFADFIYNPGATISGVLSGGLITFISIFLGYYICLAFMKISFPKECREIAESDFIKEMTMMMLSTLSLFDIVRSLLPMFETLLVFLPIWTIFLITRSIRFMHPPQDHSTSMTVLSCVAVIGAPVLTSWLFGIIIPR
ncbi:MAG: hypothetical protein NC097_05580 [Clostridium sp.]|nr:hypothetical protein [Prevotella sp.]MCM1429248.1 hypothetical protein [Clostridium sp.]MCM1475719.1 hypothetical protein [Muribaculaceae bacterium]